MNQSSDLINLKLRLDTKSAIVIHLEKLSTILSQNSFVPVDDRKIFLVTNKNLLNELISLSPSLPSNLSDQKDKQNSNENSAKFQLVLDLNSELRLKIISKLLQIQDQLRNGLESINNENKMKLVKEMFEINEDLSKLLFRTDEIEEDQFEKGLYNQKEDPTMQNLELINLEIVNLKKELLNKFKEIQKLKKVKKFDFKLKNIHKFFDAKLRQFSDLFYCGNLAWSISLGVREKKDTEDKPIKYLAFYLNCENNFDGLNCKTQFELRLLNQTTDALKIKSNNYTFNRKVGIGFHEFISENELMDDKNGWIKDDSIQLQAYLKILN